MGNTFQVRLTPSEPLLRLCVSLMTDEDLELVESWAQSQIDAECMDVRASSSLCRRLLYAGSAPEVLQGSNIRAIRAMRGSQNSNLSMLSLIVICDMHQQL